jgi:hypothetical protein
MFLTPIRSSFGSFSSKIIFLKLGAFLYLSFFKTSPSTTLRDTRPINADFIKPKTFLSLVPFSTHSITPSVSGGIDEASE